MAKQVINLGTAPSGSDGDTSYTAWGKANSNFTEVYAAAATAQAAADAAAPSADLASTASGKGSSLLGFIQSGASMVGRTALDKAREWFSPKDAGVVADGVTDDTTKLANAISDGRDMHLPKGDILVTSLSNIYGVEMRGDGRILKAITGGLQQLNSKADEGQHVFGQEYLSAFHSILLNKQDPASIVMSGDSTTNGDAATAPFRIWEILQILGTEKGHNITTTNAGHSAKHTGDWVSTYLPGDLALNPNLYVVRWGINDPYYGRSISDFTTSLRQGLAQIRASKTLAQMSILLMTPNSTSDTPNNRDERWYEQVRKVVRQAARDYQCCFIDTYAIWKDSRPAAGVYMDNAFSDGRAIHPLNVMNSWIGSKIADVIFPIGLHPRIFAASFGTLLASTTPDHYAYGNTIYSGGSGTSDFLVTNASVVTTRTADGGIHQRAFSNYDSGSNNGSYPVPQLMERTGLGTAWHPHPITEPALDLTSLLVNSWVPFVAGTNVPRAKKTNNGVTLSGLIKSGTVTSGTTLFTLPAGYRPRNTVEAFLCAMGPTGTTTPCVIHVNSTGVVQLQSTGNAAFVSLSGISFEVGA